METYNLNIANIDIDVNENGIVTRIDDKNFVKELFEIKLSENIIDDLKNNPIYLPFYLNHLIYYMGMCLPENNDDFEQLVKKEWDNWLAEDILIENGLSYYNFGHKMFAHDMIDYYGEERAKENGIFSRRYDISIPDVTITFKNIN